MQTQTIHPPRSPLAVVREAAGLTQQQLADRACVTRGTITRLEAGAHRPRRLTAGMLASVLGVDAELLFPADDEVTDAGRDQ